MWSWFLSTRVGRWLSSLLSGWYYIRKDDLRFVVTCDESALHYEGDPYAAQDKGPGNQRSAWTEWVVFYIPPWAYNRRYIAIDTYSGPRLVYFGRTRKLVFAIRAGHEAGTIRILTKAGTCTSTDNELRPQHISRWREGQPWLSVISKKDVLFI